MIRVVLRLTAAGLTEVGFVHVNGRRHDNALAQVLFKCIKAIPYEIPAS